jgi:hypothetical protein
MKPDKRSFRIALVADRYLNPSPGELDALQVLAEAGWGVMQLPAEDYPAGLAHLVLAGIAEQADEFVRDGCDLVLIGCCAGLESALAALNLDVPDQLVPSERAEILDFLTGRPAPSAAGRLWPRGLSQDA